MKFFIPVATDETQAESVYSSIRQFLAKELGADLMPDRIFRLTHKQLDARGRRGSVEAEVGKEYAPARETVIAILFERGRNVYHVCTPNRGVVRGMSLLVGADEVLHREDFE